MIPEALDTCACVPESYETLRRQQEQLQEGKRAAQMFPWGTKELPIPQGFRRFENNRGVFHFNPELIDRDTIRNLSKRGQENKFLNLGTVDKYEVALRILNGEKALYVTEYSADGVELRSAVGTDTTVATQSKYFEATKEPGSKIVIGPPPERVSKHMEGK
jgi:hypothetical protein